MRPSSAEAGNMLIYILIGVILMGALTAAILRTGDWGKDIDQERAALKGAQVMRYAAAVGTGVNALIEKGISEGDIRFAHPKAPAAYGAVTSVPTRQVFSTQGGGVDYTPPPTGSNDGSLWQFYGAVNYAQVGSARPELVMFLERADATMCASINRQLNLSIVTPVTCAGLPGSGSEFVGTFSGAPVNIPATTFNVPNAMQGCFNCTEDTTQYVYFYTLLAR